MFSQTKRAPFGQSGSIFGSSSTNTQPNQSMFGASTTSSPFSSSLGQQISGSTVPFNAPASTDTIQRSGQTTTINTKHMCYTAMKDFQNKSLEELRLEDYLANRKVPANKPSGSIFGGGTTSTFGSPSTTQQTGTSIFGSTQQNTTSNIFGSSQPQNSTSSSIFGSKPMFGSPQQQSTTSNLFGASTQNTTFGSQQNASAFGSFGQSTATTSSSSIFGSKPLFGSSTNTSTGTGLFGSQPAASSNSIFGQKPAFGQAGTTSTSGGGLFGSTSNQSSGFSFGQTATTQSSIFGQSNPQQSTGGIFGSKPATTGAGSIFGSNTATTQSGFSFGAKPATVGASTGGIFGSSTNTAAKPGAFSFSQPATTSASGFSFGASAPAAGSLFGASNAATQNKPLFGTATTTSAFSFGTNTQTATGGSLFGATSTANKPGGLTFGQPTASTGSLFGSSTSNNTSAGTLFGSVSNTSTAGSLFGAGTSTGLNKPFGSSTFGTGNTFGASTFGTPQQGGSLFGSSSTSTGGLGTNAFGTAPASTCFGLGQNNSMNDQLAQHVRAQQHVLNLVRSMPYGNLYHSIQSAGSNVQNKEHESTKESDGSSGRNQAATKAIVNALVERNRPSNTSFGSPGVGQRILPIDRAKLFSGFDEDDDVQSKPARVSIQKAVASPADHGISFDSPFFVKKDDWKKLNLPEDLRKSIIERSQASPKNVSMPQPTTSPVMDKSFSAIPQLTPQPQLKTPTQPKSPLVNRSGVKLTKPGYYMLPVVDTLEKFINERGRCVVEDLVIGRKSYGHIAFAGETDVTGINLDERGEVVIYPDDDNKPSIGYGLNRRAVVTLDGLWPKDKTTRELITQPDVQTANRFGERLEKATNRMDAIFIEYRSETGSWVFEVKHFSKYRYDDSDEDDQIEQPPPPPVTTHHTTDNFLAQAKAAFASRYLLSLDK
ncbi:Nuclear pore complex protein Nup98-Nup96 [Cichlidogyrus casuarinus]|uniref:Nuclear pore complex protein Nup98-Nup96 n=1 Tax=Cichlidogyrus casuarinus TaxID=1844966 RepID=A0ABD2QEM3_9PLAT